MKTHGSSVSMLALVLFFFAFGAQAQNQQKNMQLGLQPDGSILVPTNQLLRPAGFQVHFAGRPVDLALAADGKLLVVMNRSSLEVIRIADHSLNQTLPLEKNSTSYNGLRVLKDGRTLYVSDTHHQIHCAEFDDELVLHWKNSITVPLPSVGGDPVPGGLAFNSQENTIYVALNRNNTLAVVNRASGDVKQIAVGIAPYEVLLVSDSKAYVSNWGGRVPKAGESTYNTSGSQVLVDPQTGVANDGTVSVVDLKTQKQVREIEVGLHPCGMVLSPDKSRLYVACANSDVISVIDTRSDKVMDEISVRTDANLPFGSGPNALAISNDGKKLYCANGTDNAVCVINVGKSSKVAGFIPTGWFPGAVVLDDDAKLLFVANVKGEITRKYNSHKQGFNSRDLEGTVSIIPLPDEKMLTEMTQTVHQNNSEVQKIVALQENRGEKEIVPVPVNKSQKSVFKHVVYIIKENRTYDQVLGDMKQGNGDTALVQFGRKITPNHHKLAEDFVLLDNFNCSGVLSADGHQWTDEAYVTDYIEKFFGDFPRSYPYDGNDALAYASSGFIWDNVLRHGLTFRNYGEFVDADIQPAHSTYTQIYQDFLNGTNKIKIRAKANLAQLEPNMCPDFIGFPNTVPDVYRAAVFMKELKNFEKNDNFPNFIIMALPNDHTSGTRPGVPTPQSAVANNDLALGQIVEAISKSKFWKETCIFVTEDDPQDGLDHVDGHRTVGLVVSPYTKRGEVVSTYYSQINMVRTMENILGIPPMNQLDRAAEPMLDCFTEKPDFAPYSVLPTNIPLDQVNPPLVGLTGKQLYWAKKSLEQNLDEVDRIDEDIFNRIIWHATKGYDVPYPELTKK